MVFALMVACAPKGGDMIETQDFASLQIDTASPVLSAIDSLMWQQPDSALARLLPYFDTCCRDVSRNVSEDTNDTSLGDVSGNVSTFNHHYAHLLLAELLYKNDYAQTNRAELLEAVGYFDSLMADTRGVSLHGFHRRDARRASAQNTAFLDARAHYINGVGYYEHDSVVPACKEYLKALEVMEEHFEEKELIGNKANFIALTHTHLLGLFSDMYLDEQALYFGKSSLKYYQKYNAEPWHIVWILNNIGSHFDIMNNYDSALYYYQQGLKILSDTNSLIYRDITSHIAFLSYRENGDPSHSLNQLHKILVNAESDQEYTARCLTIGIY